MTRLFNELVIGYNQKCVQNPPLKTLAQNCVNNQPSRPSVQVYFHSVPGCRLDINLGHHNCKNQQNRSRNPESNIRHSGRAYSGKAPTSGSPGPAQMQDNNTTRSNPENHLQQSIDTRRISKRIEPDCSAARPHSSYDFPSQIVCAAESIRPEAARQVLRSTRRW